MPNMAPEDIEIANALCEKDEEFKKLWNEHADFKARLDDLKLKTYLTAEEEAEVKRLKTLKLQGKDKIALKIKEYKVNVLSTA